MCGAAQRAQLLEPGRQAVVQPVPTVDVIVRDRELHADWKGETAVAAGRAVKSATQPTNRDRGYVLRLLPEPGNPRWRQRIADDIGFGLRHR